MRLFSKEPIVTGDMELGSVMRLSEESALKGWDPHKYEGIGFTKTAKWGRPRPQQKATKTHVRGHGCCCFTDYYSSLRPDVYFERGAHATSYKWWLEDTQSKETRGALGASASFSPVVQSAKVSVDAHVEQNISEGGGNLRFELSMPMIVKSIDLTEEERNIELKEGEFICHAVMLGAKASGTIKAVGGASSKVGGSLNASGSATMNRNKLSQMGGEAYAQGEYKTQGPKRFSMEVQLEGGPMLKTNKQKETANELLNWFEKEWKSKVEKSPHLWKVLRVNVHGDYEYLEERFKQGQNVEKERQEAEEQERLRQHLKEKEEELRKKVSSGSDQIQADLRDYQLASKSGGELEKAVSELADNQAKCRLALENAMVVNDFEKVAQAREQYKAVAGPGCEANTLLAKADVVTKLQEEPARLKDALDKAETRLAEALSKLPDVNVAALPEALRLKLKRQSSTVATEDTQLPCVQVGKYRREVEDSYVAYEDASKCYFGSCTNMNEQYKEAKQIELQCAKQAALMAYDRDVRLRLKADEQVVGERTEGLKILWAADFKPMGKEPMSRLTDAVTDVAVGAVESLSQPRRPLALTHSNFILPIPVQSHDQEKTSEIVPSERRLPIPVQCHDQEKTSKIASVEQELPRSRRSEKTALLSIEL